jgi:hypothetical protein
MKMNDLKRLATMTSEQYKTENPNYEPMFPKGWDEDSKWPDLTYNYDSFRSIQIEIDDYTERMAGCYDTE